MHVPSTAALLAMASRFICPTFSQGKPFQCSKTDRPLPGRKHKQHANGWDTKHWSSKKQLRAFKQVVAAAVGKGLPLKSSTHDHRTRKMCPPTAPSCDIQHPHLLHGECLIIPHGVQMTQILFAYISRQVLAAEKEPHTRIRRRRSG